MLVQEKKEIKDSTEAKIIIKSKDMPVPLQQPPAKPFAKQNKTHYLSIITEPFKKNVVNQLNFSLMLKKNQVLLLVQKIIRHFKVNKSR